jgi:hypothetical protein
MERTKIMEERRQRGCWFSMLIIVGLILLCGGVTTLVVDWTCYSNIAPRLPSYPNAKVVSEEHNLLRPFGMGMTQIILFTPDDIDTVRSWYGRAIGEAAKNFIQNRTGSMGEASWDLDTPPDGKGTQITLYSRCAS